MYQDAFLSTIIFTNTFAFVILIFGKLFQNFGWIINIEDKDSEYKGLWDGFYLDKSQSSDKYVFLGTSFYVQTYRNAIGDLAAPNYDFFRAEE